MKIIQLTQGKSALVDDSDFEYLNTFKWYFFKKYARRRIGLKKIFMHREIMALSDPKIQCDHKDGNGLNNQRANLRIASHSQNQANKKSSNKSTSNYRGVSWDKSARKWRATVYKDRKPYYLGLFADELDAASAYNIAAAKFHGEFAIINRHKNFTK